MVGVLVGTILWLLGNLLGQAAPVLQAAIVLAVWVALTGALHLDGLADTADAWIGGFGDRERTLTIMKDPRSGPIAVVAVIIVLLLKFAALYVLLEHHQLDAVLLVPWLARVALPGLLLVTPYARPGGLGQVLVDHMPKRLLRLVLAAHVIAMLLVIRESLIALLMAVLQELSTSNQLIKVRCADFTAHCAKVCIAQVISNQQEDIRLMRCLGVFGKRRCAR